MRKVFREKPTQRQVVNELLELIESYEDLPTSFTVNFWDDCGHARYDPPGSKGGEAFTFPDPDWTEKVSGPDYRWESYWAIIAHEVSHYLNHKWFGGINHREVFYSTMIALCLSLDLPTWSYDEGEKNYHGLGYRRGKKMSADLLLDRIRAIAQDRDCPERTIYSTDYCVPPFSNDTPCTVHSPESSDSTPEPPIDVPTQQTESPKRQ